MLLIPLTQDRYAQVDDEDYDWLMQWKWHYSHGYALRNFQRNNRRIRIYMHRLIMHTPNGMDTDHIDKNGLNNQKNNLRVCNHKENISNQRLHKNNTSGYKGVFFAKHANKWRARIHPNRKAIHLGYFDNVLDAAKAYDAAAKILFGEFADLNFPVK